MNLNDKEYGDETMCDENIFKVRDMIRNLMDYNLDAEFLIIGYDGMPVPIDEFNVGWQLGEGEDANNSVRDVYSEKQKCIKLCLFPNDVSEKEI